jgi:hypothetical protein
MKDRKDRKKYIGEPRAGLVVMVTAMSILPPSVTKYIAENTTNKSFCASGFWVRPSRINSVTLVTCSMKLVLYLEN